MSEVEVFGLFIQCHQMVCWQACRTSAAAELQVHENRIEGLLCKKKNLTKNKQKKNTCAWKKLRHVMKASANLANRI